MPKVSTTKKSSTDNRTKNKDLVKLQKEWYKKLADSGFKDTEYFDASMEPRDIQKRDTYKHALEIQHKFVPTANHYTYARQLLHTDLIPLADRAVWALYAEGIPYRAIAKECGISYTAVCKTVNRTLPILKEYRKEEMEYRHEAEPIKAKIQIHNTRKAKK